MSKILITGATGFIGSYLCQYFLNQGMEVIAGVHQPSSQLQHSLSGAEILPFDVLSDTIPKVEGVDTIIHTATANDVVSKQPKAGVCLSTLGTRQVLECAVQNEIPNVLVFSTFQVYGTEVHGHITETTPVTPQNDYALNHLFAEDYVRMYAQAGKIQGIIVRPSNVYGRIVSPTFNRWSLVPGCFCKEALEQGKITLKSSGKQRRNFVSLLNVARACQALLGTFSPSPEVFNIGSSQTHTIREVAEQVQALYVARYNKALPLEIQQDTPLESNTFSISQEKLHRAGFEESSQETLRTEINALYDYLEQTAPHALAR